MAGYGQHGSQWVKFPPRMLMKNFESSLVYCEAHAPIVNNHHIRSKFKTFLTAKGPVFLIQLQLWFH